ncbi:hypothetical protein M9H77_03432 [Catharanthus roseus]|uniref:Uncharacterized protein n=1 Tax=Catharanthus roseus TaxID=4058 RepID=A0ACC0CB71_CATRO|nr:hypothetical protein M9H77_03432 [Catharanthus roseus]
MAAIEKYLQFQQDSVIPCKIRAKRGCATHPRSNAEGMKRTRISDRMKKLQELFPNMEVVSQHSVASALACSLLDCPFLSVFCTRFLLKTLLVRLLCLFLFSGIQRVFSEPLAVCAYWGSAPFLGGDSFAPFLDYGKEKRPEKRLTKQPVIYESLPSFCDSCPELAGKISGQTTATVWNFWCTCTTFYCRYYETICCCWNHDSGEFTSWKWEGHSPGDESQEFSVVTEQLKSAAVAQITAVEDGVMQVDRVPSGSKNDEKKQEQSENGVVGNNETNLLPEVGQPIVGGRSVDNKVMARQNPTANVRA